MKTLISIFITTTIISITIPVWGQGYFECRSKCSGFDWRYTLGTTDECMWHCLKEKRSTTCTVPYIKFKIVNDETQKGKTTWRFPSEGKITWLEKVVTKDYDDCMRETANRWEPCMKTCPDPFLFVVDTRIIKFGLRDDGVVVWREVIK